MSDTLQLLPGQSPPFAIITPTDQRGVLWIVTAFCFATATVSLVIRAYVRIEFSQSYGKDDVFISGALIAFVVQSALVFFEVKQGVGRTISEVNSHNFSSLQKAYYASDLFYLVTLWTTKCSAILLLSRLTAKTKYDLISKIILGTTAVLGLISFLITALDCRLDAPWIFIGKQCAGKAGRWETVAVCDIITELAIFANLVFIMYDVKLRPKKKAIVLVGFGFRLLMLPPIAFRLHYVLSEVNSSDPTLKLANVVILTQVELVVAIVSATVPCLRPFMAATYTTWGGRVDTVSDSGYHKRAYAAGQNGSANTAGGTTAKDFRSIRIGRSKNNTETSKSQEEIGLEPMNPRGKKKSPGWEEVGNALEDGRDDRYPSTTTKESGYEYIAGSSTNPVQEDQQSSGSHDSQNLIIRRDIEWAVSYEPRPSPSPSPSGGHTAQQEGFNGRALP